MKRSIYTKKQNQHAELIEEIIYVYAQDEEIDYSDLIKELSFASKMMLEVTEDTDAETDAYLREYYDAIKQLHKAKESLWLLLPGQVYTKNDYIRMATEE